MSLNTLERDDLLRRIAWLNAEVDKIKRMLKGEQMGTARIADAAITNAKISDLTWDKAQGGTATLGGLNNTDGVLEINDAADTQIGKWDKDGILINDGKLEIRNDGDVVSIDSKGIVSSANFTQTISSNNSLNQIISGSSETDITGSAINFLNSRYRQNIILLSVSSWLNQSAGNTANLKIRLMYNFDGGSWVEVASLINTGIAITDSSGHTYTTYSVGSQSGVGTYNLKLTAQLESITGNPTATIHNFRMSIVILGT